MKLIFRDLLFEVQIKEGGEKAQGLNVKTGFKLRRDIKERKSSWSSRVSETLEEQSFIRALGDTWTRRRDGEEMASRSVYISTWRRSSAASHSVSFVLFFSSHEAE